MTSGVPRGTDATSGRSLVLIGASTGGVRALGALFDRLPVLNAAVVVIQHMPAFIQASFVRSLGTKTDMDVALARDGETLEPGSVRIVPADVHGVLEGNRRIRLVSGPKVHYVRPSVDVTMKSAVACAPPGQLVGILLTGMGRDGADGMVHLRRLGARTMAQDEASSAVFGMPKEAWMAGGAELLLPPDRIARQLAWWVGST